MAADIIPALIFVCEADVSLINIPVSYTHLDVYKRQVLYCVVSKKEIVQLKDIVEQIDPNAFVIVSDAREVLGEGFREFRQ